jgi:hypothetical protein
MTQQRRTIHAWGWALLGYSFVVVGVAGFVAWDWWTPEPSNPSFSGIWLFLVAPHACALIDAAVTLTGALYVLAVLVVTVGLNAATFALIRRALTKR